jgi:hypothetical protein
MIPAAFPVLEAEIKDWWSGLGSFMDKELLDDRSYRRSVRVTLHDGFERNVQRPTDLPSGNPYPICEEILCHKACDVSHPAGRFVGGKTEM